MKPRVCFACVSISNTGSVLGFFRFIVYHFGILSLFICLFNFIYYFSVKTILSRLFGDFATLYLEIFLGCSILWLWYCLDFLTYPALPLIGKFWPNLEWRNQRVTWFWTLKKLICSFQARPRFPNQGQHRQTGYLLILLYKQPTITETNG